MKYRYIKTIKKTAISTLILVIMLALIFKSFEYFACYLFGNTPNYRGEYARLITTIVAGILAIIALWLNQKRTKALEDQTINQTKQIELTRKGQVDERFKNAIEHLGNDNKAIVLGGIYALHRIAKDDITYRLTVFDILCSYIREKTSNEKFWSDYSKDERKSFKPSILIQTIIDLLFKCNQGEQYIYDGQKANLIGIRCIKADFCNAFLVEADLSMSYLERANFSGANMKAARLLGCNLEGSEMTKSHLEGANAIGCHMKSAFLVGAHLQGAILFSANLEGAHLPDAHMEGVNLYGALMKNANLSKAHLENAYLARAFMEGAYLANAHLEGSDLNEVHLEGADLTDANLEGADVNDLFIEGAVLTGSNWEGVYISEVRIQSISFRHLSFAEEIDWQYRPLDFSYIMHKRIEKESEFSNVHDGKLNENKAKEIIEKMSSENNDLQSLVDFKLIIEKATKRKTNIKKDAIIGVLSKGKADEIIERYHKAMENFPTDI